VASHPVNQTGERTGLFSDKGNKEDRRL